MKTGLFSSGKRSPRLPADFFLGLSVKYIYRILHGKCFVRCLHTSCSVSEIEQVSEANE